MHVLTSSAPRCTRCGSWTSGTDIVLTEATNDRGALDPTWWPLRSPSIVFHLGAYTHVGKSWNRANECIQTNIQGSVNLFQVRQPPQPCDGWCTPARARSTATSKSRSAKTPRVEARSSPYSVSKYGGELFLPHAAPWVGDGPSLSFGPSMPTVPLRARTGYSGDHLKALRGERLLMTRGTQTREFNYVGRSCRWAS